ncbi:MAG: hypothetical protein V1757_02660, partial [Actinomycetota bacterium]
MGTTRETAIGSTWAAAAWVFVAAAVAVVIVGMSNLYPRPDALRIESFAKLYRQLGLSDSLMITVVLVLPFSFAVASACVILSRRSHDRSSVFLAVGLVALYLFVSGAIIGIDVAWVRNLVASIAIVTLAWFVVGFPTRVDRPPMGQYSSLRGDRGSHPRSGPRYSLERIGDRSDPFWERCGGGNPVGYFRSVDRCPGGPVPTPLHPLRAVS